MDISTMTIEQLKALAYDQLIALEQTQDNLRALNDEIKKKSQSTVNSAEKSGDA